MEGNVGPGTHASIRVRWLFINRKNPMPFENRFIRFWFWTNAKKPGEK